MALQHSPVARFGKVRSTFPFGIEFGLIHVRSLDHPDGGRLLRASRTSWLMIAVIERDTGTKGDIHVNTPPSPLAYDSAALAHWSLWASQRAGLGRPLPGVDVYSVSLQTPDLIRQF